jgi:hypothetical protein
VNGLAKFQDIQITANGMYLVTYTIFSPDDQRYNFSCFSNPITVATSIPTYDPTLPPNYIVKFDGDINKISKHFFHTGE